jgi:hypothetical protein
MSAPKRRPAPESPDLSTQTDFQLLNSLANLVSKEASSQLTVVAWEIMRRYTTSLGSQGPTKRCGYEAILKDARWGDAKRVEAIFGIKRGVLIRLREAGLIRSKPLEDDREDAGEVPAVRAKRLYELISIAEYLESDE